MTTAPVLRMVDTVTVAVPTLDERLRVYRDVLGHELLWRNNAVGQVGLRLPHATELALATDLPAEPTWLVRSVEEAVGTFVTAGGRILSEPTNVPVGWLAVIADPFGNRLVLIELSSGMYETDADHQVTGVRPG